jgi:pilus assembly protein CpaD
MNTSRFVFLASAFLALSACENPFAPTLHPDYAIRVTPTAGGSVATPPPCPSWNTENANPFDNQPLPQFGCANARNLASMVENPDDLLEGRTLANARGVHAVGEVRRYDNDQTRGLIMPSAEDSNVAITTSSTGSSSMSGDVTGGTPSSSSSGASVPTP